MLVLSPRKPLCRVFAGAPILLKLSVVSPRRTAPYVGDVIDTRIAAFRYRSIYLPVALSEAGGQARPPPVAEKGRARSGSNRERRAGGLPHALRDHVATGARKEEQRPYDNHPESSTAPTNAGKHPLCSSRLRRTRHKPPGLRRTVSYAPPVLLFWTAQRPVFSSSQEEKMGGWPRGGAARSRAVRRRRDPPSRPRGPTTPVPARRRTSQEPAKEKPPSCRPLQTMLK